MFVGVFPGASGRVRSVDYWCADSAVLQGDHQLGANGWFGGWVDGVSR